MLHITDAEAARMLGLVPSAMPSWTQGLVITDSTLPDNPIVYANAQFTALTGYTLDEIIGRNCRFLQGPGSNPSTVAAIREAIENHRLFSGEILNYKKDGTAFWNHLSLGPLRRIKPERYFVGLQLDVSDRMLESMPS
jgi:PAS domain S-box-containing protein